MTTWPPLRCLSCPVCWEGSSVPGGENGLCMRTGACLCLGAHAHWGTD